jgi:hypothetical protein
VILVNATCEVLNPKVGVWKPCAFFFFFFGPKSKPEREEYSAVVPFDAL